MDLTLRIVGYVRSSYTTKEQCPCHESEGGAEVVIEIAPEYAEALHALEVGAVVHVLTWMHRADRSYLQVHPRGDVSRDKRGVFATRSPDRPNPVGLHIARVLEVDGLHLRAAPMDVLDGTPIIDIKPYVGREEGA